LSQSDLWKRGIELNRQGSLRGIKQIYVAGCLSALLGRGAAPRRHRVLLTHLLKPHCSYFKCISTCLGKHACLSSVPSIHSSASNHPIFTTKLLSRDGSDYKRGLDWIWDLMDSFIHAARNCIVQATITYTPVSTVKSLLGLLAWYRLPTPSLFLWVLELSPCLSHRNSRLTNQFLKILKRLKILTLFTDSVH
jgi:hypothetical protein